MNILFVVLGCGLVYLLAYVSYGRFLANKVFKLDDSKTTPAVEYNDGQDFVPAKKGFLLGQHFSAIAAAGPINGPILAAVLFGWAPALLWCLLGAIFIGGVHDMGSLVASVRYKAKSITEVIRRNVSRRAWLLFMVFIWITLVYVIVAFTDITASSFVGNVVLENGDTVLGAGIASSSLMYLALPIAMGLLMRKTGLGEGKATLLFLPLVGVAIVLGQQVPLALPLADVALQQKAWGVLILAYCLVASMTPMWLLLQPRGALGGYFLYAALLVAAIGLAFGGFKIEYPAFVSPPAGAPLFPVLFITIACGACSGFHALVSSGTTSKQLSLECHAKPVGYGAMLLEGMLACIAVSCVMVLAADSDVIQKAPNFIYAQGIGRFMELLGIPATVGISFGLLAFTTFVYDTLDVCTRLGRYIVEEVTGLKGFKGSLLGTSLTAGVPIFFLFQTMADERGAVIPAWRLFWNTFGASNQLLAALALVGVSLWLKNESKRAHVWWVAFLPALWMFGVSIFSLAMDIYNGWVLNTGHPVVPFIACILIALALLVGMESLRAMLPKAKQPMPC